MSLPSKCRACRRLAQLDAQTSYCQECQKHHLQAMAERAGQPVRRRVSLISASTTQPVLGACLLESGQTLDDAAIARMADQLWLAPADIEPASIENIRQILQGLAWGWLAVMRSDSPIAPLGESLPDPPEWRAMPKQQVQARRQLRRWYGPMPQEDDGDHHDRDPD